MLVRLPISDIECREQAVLEPVDGGAKRSTQRLPVPERLDGRGEEEGQETEGMRLMSERRRRGRKQARQNRMRRGRQSRHERLEERVRTNIERPRRLGRRRLDERRPGGRRERADEVAHLLGLGVGGRLRKVAELVVDALGRERRGRAGLREAILDPDFLLEGVEDVVEAMSRDTEGLPASLPDAFIFGEVAESTRTPSVGSKIGEGEEGENEDVEIDREATDELKGGVAFGPGMGWRLLVGKLVYRETLRRGGRGGCVV